MVSAFLIRCMKLMSQDPSPVSELSRVGDALEGAADSSVEWLIACR